MASHPDPVSSLQMQSSMLMLRQSLKQVFPAREDRSVDRTFGHLLRQLDEGKRI
jgi:hypothetical protein